VIRHPPGEVANFLALLFADLHAQEAADIAAVLDIATLDDSGRCTIAGAAGEPLFCGRLGVDCAAVLFDQVIYHLLDQQKDGVALHAGALARLGRTVLLPGQSGSGKSSLTAWLVKQGFSYLTDELVFLPDDGSCRLIPFPRPLCLKAGSAALVSAMLPAGHAADVLHGTQGAVIPHRLLNPVFSPVTAAPSLIVFPQYQAGASLRLDTVSGARAASMLMACDVNARNLADHGFGQLTRLARSVPAWRVTYGSFAQLAAMLPVLWPE
jgi:hypothetical protein